MNLDEYTGAQKLAVAFEDMANNADWIHIDHIAEREGGPGQRVTVLIGPWFFVERATSAATALARIRERWQMQREAAKGGAA